MLEPEPVRCPVCGDPLEGLHVRFHYAKPYTDPETLGHYVDGDVRDLLKPVNEPESDEGGLGMTPAPPARPKLPKGMKAPLEVDVRLDGISYMRIKGYKVYDMEQGYRPERGGPRVAVGFPDCYFHGHGLRGFIEFKRADGQPARKKQSPEQKAFEREELANGGIYLLVEATAQLVSWHEAQRVKQLEVEV